MKDKIDYSLYLVTDRTLMSTESLEEAVLLALEGGCTVVQLREKDMSSLEFYRSAVSLKSITRRCGVPLIVNDRVDIALAAGADGVHVGQGDIPAEAVRGTIRPGMILGVSVTDTAQALKAQADGADYLGVGAMYTTGTKSDAQLVTVQELKKVRAAVSVPVVAIGGINKNTVPDLAGTGIDGLAVVSAVISQNNIRAASRELLELFRRYVPIRQ